MVGQRILSNIMLLTISIIVALGAVNLGSSPSLLTAICFIYLF